MISPSLMALVQVSLNNYKMDMELGLEEGRGKGVLPPVNQNCESMVFILL